MKSPAAVLVVACLMSGCKPEPPPVPVPLTKAVSGVEAPCEHLVYGGFPRHQTPGEGTFFICRPGYALNYDPSTKTSQWVVEHLEADNLKRDRAAKDIADHRPDPNLPKKARTNNDDFVGTGYERVYLAPATDFLYDDILYSHSFYLTNAVHLHGDRVPALKALEETVRSMAQARGQLYVITGPVYENGGGRGWVGVPDKLRQGSAKSAHKGKVMVPTHIFKVVIDPQAGKSIGFLVENTPLVGAASSPGYEVVPVATIEKLTGMVFAPDLPQDAGRRLKSTH